MSDTIRRIIGTFLILICAVLCIIPTDGIRFSGGDRYISGSCTKRAAGPTETDISGDISVNTANAEELSEIPGIGDTISALIIAERDKNGFFYYVEDLEAVKGIGPRTLEKFRPLINLSLDESGEQDGISRTVP